MKYWISRSKRKKVLTDLPISGRPSKLKSAKAMKLLQNAKYKRGNSTGTIARKFSKRGIHHVSHQTVARSVKAIKGMEATEKEEATSVHQTTKTKAPPVCKRLQKSTYGLRNIIICIRKLLTGLHICRVGVSQGLNHSLASSFKKVQ